MPQQIKPPKAGELVETWDYSTRHFNMDRPEKVYNIFGKDMKGNWMIELVSGLMISVEPSPYPERNRPQWREVPARG